MKKIIPVMVLIVILAAMAIVIINLFSSRKSDFYQRGTFVKNAIIVHAFDKPILLSELNRNMQ